MAMRETAVCLALFGQPLCSAAIFQVRGDLAKVLRPKADDPRPYSELLDRLGAYEPLTALLWLASHGCDADATLSEAEALIKTYQPSPSSGLMLGRLERLHRKPSSLYSSKCGEMGGGVTCIRWLRLCLRNWPIRNGPQHSSYVHRITLK